jgi:predicted nucleic acid-binding Zn finger protein
MKKEEFYYPTVAKFEQYGTTPWECSCSSSTKGHKTCKHIKAMRVYRNEECVFWGATLLSQFNRPDCECYDFERSGECVHIYVLTVAKESIPAETVEL